MNRSTPSRLLSAAAATIVSLFLLQGVSSLADTPADVRLATLSTSTTAATAPRA